MDTGLNRIGCGPVGRGLQHRSAGGDVARKWLVVLMFALAPLTSGQPPAASPPSAAPVVAADGAGSNQEPAAGQQSSSADAAPHSELDDENALLLKLATELKAEVDKTTKDVLSLQVIRKAAAIERLTHTARARMKASAN